MDSFIKVDEERDNLDQLKNFNIKSGIYQNSKDEEKQPTYEQEELRDRLMNALRTSSVEKSKYDLAYNRGSSFSLTRKESIKKSIDKLNKSFDSGIIQKDTDQYKTMN